MELFGTLVNAATVSHFLKNMVRPWGFEPQASTLSLLAIYLKIMA